MAGQGTHRGAGRRLTERQAQIVQGALRVIAANGSRRFSVQRLAQEVGLTGGALYRHFPGMDEIVDAVVERVGEVLFDGFPPDADDPIERLKLFFYQRVRTIRGNPDIARLLLSDHLAQAGSHRQSARLGKFKRRSQAFVVGCLEEASAAGALADGLAPEAGAFVVLGSMLALAHADKGAANGEAGEYLFDEVWFGIERMLRCRPGAAPAKRRPARSSRRGATE